MPDKEKDILWEGPEVEGRFKGLLTVFVGNPATLQDLQSIDVMKYQHIYLNEEVIFKEGVFDWIRGLPTHIIVSWSFYNMTSIWELPVDILERLVITLVIVTDAFGLLKSTDMVKFEVGPFTNYQTTVHNFTRTVPDDYGEDIIWPQK